MSHISDAPLRGLYSNRIPNDNGRMISYGFLLVRNSEWP